MTYKMDLWRQGRLLLTNQTVRWSNTAKERAQAQEECMIFRHFKYEDDGKSRTLVAVCESPSDAARIVEDHNNREYELEDVYKRSMSGEVGKTKT